VLEPVAQVALKQADVTALSALRACGAGHHVLLAARGRCQWCRSRRWLPHLLPKQPRHLPAEHGRGRLLRRAVLRIQQQERARKKEKKKQRGHEQNCDDRK
jgi:hypothetical protein